MNFKLIKVLFVGAALIVSASLHATEVTVFAAASLTDSLKEIAAAYEKESGDKIIFNFGASSTLARQIEEGATRRHFLFRRRSANEPAGEKGVD